MNSPHKCQWRGALMFSLICKRLSKQSWGWWFDTPSRPLWRHSNDVRASEIRYRWSSLRLQMCCHQTVPSHQYGQHQYVITTGYDVLAALITKYDIIFPSCLVINNLETFSLIRRIFSKWRTGSRETFLNQWWPNNPFYWRKYASSGLPQSTHRGWVTNIRQ